MEQWFRFHASTAGSVGSIPVWGTNVPHAVWCGQKIFLKYHEKRKRKPAAVKCIKKNELEQSATSTPAKVTPISYIYSMTIYSGHICLVF